jgi:hypothetical protein
MSIINNKIIAIWRDSTESFSNKVYATAKSIATADVRTTGKNAE